MYAGEALALGDAGHVDQVARLEQVADREDLADRHVIDAVDPELADGGDLGQVLELAGLRLVQPLGDLRADLDGRVAVALGGAQLRDGVRLDGEHRDGHHRPVVLEDLGHADLAADETDL